ncbi:hypothetical protein ACIQ4Z_17520 [Peribacillus asahii]|uniref:hypothetical protein n=1 Tax=Peribacillus asahii TaxID=228899 RepID=UPI0038188A36
MLIIYDATTKLIKSIGGHRGSDISSQMVDSIEFHLSEGEDFVRVYDNNKIKSIWEANDTDGKIELIFSSDGEIINVEATIGQNKLDPRPELTEIDYLLDLDYRLSMIELGL